MNRSHTTGSPTAQAIQDWIIARIAAFAGLSPQEIDPSETFAHYGLDSMQAVSLSGDLEEWLGRRLAATLIWDYPTIAGMAEYLAAGADE